MFYCEASINSLIVNSEHADAVAALNGLKIWKENPMPGGLPGWLIADTFRKSLKVSLLGG